MVGLFFCALATMKMVCLVLSNAKEDWAPDKKAKYVSFKEAVAERLGRSSASCYAQRDWDNIHHNVGVTDLGRELRQEMEECGDRVEL